MRQGMLWFDNSKKKSMLLKIIEAATYYRKKYGKSPEQALIHPLMLKSDVEHGLVELNGGFIAKFFYGAESPDSREVFAVGPQHQSTEIQVILYRPVLIGHIWVGMKDEETSEQTDPA